MSENQLTLVITSDLHGHEVYKLLCDPKFILNTKERFDITFTIDNEKPYFFEIKHGDLGFNVSDVSSIYCKRIIVNNFNHKLPNHISDFIQRETQEVIIAVICICNFLSDGLIINQGKQFNLSRNKILQLITASNIGFTIPKTCITNNIQAADDFYKECSKDIIYKCLSQPIVDYGNNTRSMIHTSSVTSDDFSKVYYCPSCFQENIAKEYELRIAVIGDETIAVRINSQAFDGSRQDWRKEIGNKDIYERYFLPKDIASKLVDLNKKLNLMWSMVDMIFSKDGNYVFLEANPDGAWLWLEEFFPELCITESIARFIQQQKGASHD